MNDFWQIFRFVIAALLTLAGVFCMISSVSTLTASAVSLNCTPPQPFNCTSIKPGERMAPFSERCSISGGSSATGQTLLIRPSAITTAWSSRNSWPVKIRPWVNAYILTPDFKK